MPNKIDFSKFEFRCSALGKIMSKSNSLTDGNKTYLRETFIGEIYSIRKEVTSKYFEKGNYMEEDAVSMINKALYPDKILIKNKERKHNGFIHGECDTIAPDQIVYDCKNAWDLFSFGKADLTWDYMWQGIGYMWLWEKKKFRLFYCLNNMPEHLLIGEEKKLFYQHNFVTYEDEEYQNLCLELRAKHNYDQMPIEEKFKIWELDGNEDTIEVLKDKIQVCRKFMCKLYDEYLEQIEINKRLMGKKDLKNLLKKVS